MNAIDERAIREQLEQAVAPLDPAAPPLDLLRSRAYRRRWIRFSAAGLVTACVAALVFAISFVHTTTETGILVVSPPSRGSLTSYAESAHGSHVAGPIKTRTGYYGAFAVKQGIQVVQYRGFWRPDGGVVRAYGGGRFVEALSSGGDLIADHPSFVVRFAGSRIPYFGGVVYQADGKWVAARFGSCRDGNVDDEASCPYRGRQQPYGRVVNGVFTSIHDACRLCAGKQWRVTWQWVSEWNRFGSLAGHPANAKGPFPKVSTKVVMVHK